MSDEQQREDRAPDVRATIKERLWKADGDWLVAPREDGAGWVGESRFKVGRMNAPTLADAHNRSMAEVARAGLDAYEAQEQRYNARELCFDAQRLEWAGQRRELAHAAVVVAEERNALQAERDALTQALGEAQRKVRERLGRILIVRQRDGATMFDDGRIHELRWVELELAQPPAQDPASKTERR